MTSKRTQPEGETGVDNNGKRVRASATSPFELQGNEISLLLGQDAGGKIAVRSSETDPEADLVDSPSTLYNDSETVPDALRSWVATALDHAVPDLPDGFKVLAYWGALKGANPFWVTTTTENPTLYRKIRYTLANNPPANRTPPALTLLGRHRLTEQVVHLDDAIRVYACRVFIRNLQIPENDITDNILKSLFDVDSAVAGGWRTKILRFQATWQSQMLNYMLSGVTNLMDAVGTPEKWASSTAVQRARLFGAYYDQDPKFSFFLFFKGSFYGIDINGIFANNEPERRKWQRYLKSIFLWVAEDTYSLRLKILPASKPPPPRPVKYVANNFRQLAWCDAMKPLGLGDLDELPVSRTGVFDLQRRALLEPVLIEGLRVLAD